MTGYIATSRTCRSIRAGRVTSTFFGRGSDTPMVTGAGTNFEYGATIGGDGDGLTLDSTAGIITTVDLELAFHNRGSFPITNSKCTANSVVLANVIGYTGTLTNAGLPTCIVTNIEEGSFKISIINQAVIYPSALNGAVKIGFLII